MFPRSAWSQRMPPETALKQSNCSKTKQLLKPADFERPLEIARRAKKRSHPFPIHARVLERACQKSIFPWALWLSKGISFLKDAFEAICPLHHSGVGPSLSEQKGTPLTVPRETDPVPPISSVTLPITEGVA